MTQEQKQKYQYDVFEGWSTEYDGNQHHTYTLIAYDNESVDQWLHDNYDLKDSEDLSDDIILEYEHSGSYTVSDHGNLIDVEVTDDMLDDNGELKEPYFYQTDYVRASREELTEQNLDYLKSGKYWTTVIDLTDTTN